MIWNDIKKKKPLAIYGGRWDGLKSDKILVYTRSGKYKVAEMYEGILDGNQFCEFYDDRDCLISDVIYWTSIDSPN